VETVRFEIIQLKKEIERMHATCTHKMTTVLLLLQQRPRHNRGLSFLRQRSVAVIVKMLKIFKE
jgi:hypothetical protein